MEAKHTPGPWRWEFMGTTGQWHLMAGDRMVEMGGSPDSPLSPDQVLAAAAPDLLAAAVAVLKGLNARIDAADETAVPVFAGIAALSDAINKATGATP